MKAITILTKARSLIANPENWTKGTDARNRKGYPVCPESKTAHSFCAYGTLYKSSGVAGPKLAERALQPFIGRYNSLTNFNDQPRRTHKQILSIFDKAIAGQEVQG